MANLMIIDAWNVCFKLPETAALIPVNLEQARAKLNILVKSFFADKKVNYKLIYDGQPRIPSGTQDISVSFSQNPQTADDLIIKFIQKQKNKHAITVITSDRQLSLRARDFGTRVTSSEDFIKKLRKRHSVSSNNDSNEHPRVGKHEIDYWMDKFKGNKHSE